MVTVLLVSWTFGTFTNKHARDLSYRFRPIRDSHWKEWYSRAQDELNHKLTFGVFGENGDDQILYLMKRTLLGGDVTHEVSAILCSSKDHVCHHIATRHFLKWHIVTFENRSIVASDKLPQMQRDMFS